MESAGVEVDRKPSDRSRYALAAFMIGAGITHFVAPGFYERIVPKWFGHEKVTVRLSGVAELLCGALVAVPRTKRLGAWATVVVLVVVYPANIQMAVEAAKPSNAEEWVAWLRLPLQLPLIRWAYRHTR
jgi:uncharacterized membrane protein